MIYSPVGRTAKKNKLVAFRQKISQLIVVDLHQLNLGHPMEGGNPPGIRIIQVMDEMLVTFIERTMEKRLKILKTQPSNPPYSSIFHDMSKQLDGLIPL